MKRLFYLGLIAMFASCIKPDPVAPVGEIKVRFVNSVLSSTPQDIFIRGVKVPNSVAVPYGQYSPYYSTSSGDISLAFANAGVSEGVGNAGFGGSIDIGSNISMYYFKKQKVQNTEGALAAAVVFDDLTPVAGKAKVRFIHLNTFLINFINIKKGDGAILSEGIAFTNSSAYFQVDPGTKFSLNATGLVEPLVVDPNVQAGKNYTIWIDGPSDSVLVSHTILHN
ncbi:MAG: DUF4397 domain-containing protein [Bacteroidota bacterium]